MFLFGSRSCSCSACADGLGRVSRGGQHLGLLGIFSTNSVVRLEKSPNRLRYFPTRGNIRTCVSIKSVVHCRALYTSPTLRLVFYDYREVAMDGWTKGGIEVVYWSVPSFQHTIYPPKSPSLFFLLLLPLMALIFQNRFRMSVLFFNHYKKTETARMSGICSTFVARFYTKRN